MDYEGTGPQLAHGGMNCTLSFTAGSSQYELKSILAPTIPHNIEIGCGKGAFLICLLRTVPTSSASIPPTRDRTQRSIAKL